MAYWQEIYQTGHDPSELHLTAAYRLETLWRDTSLIVPTLLGYISLSVMNLETEPVEASEIAIATPEEMLALGIDPSQPTEPVHLLDHDVVVETPTELRDLGAEQMLKLFRGFLDSRSQIGVQGMREIYVDDASPEGVALDGIFHRLTASASNNFASPPPTDTGDLPGHYM